MRGRYWQNAPNGRERRRKTTSHRSSSCTGRGGVKVVSTLCPPAPGRATIRPSRLQRALPASTSGTSASTPGKSGARTSTSPPRLLATPSRGRMSSSRKSGRASNKRTRVRSQFAEKDEPPVVGLLTRQGRVGRSARYALWPASPGDGRLHSGSSSSASSSSSHATTCGSRSSSSTPSRSCSVMPSASRCESM